MMPSKKSDAAMIIAGMPSSAPAMPEPDMDMDPTNAAAEEILAALESKDASALSEALKSFVSMCNDADGGDSEPIMAPPSAE